MVLTGTGETELPEDARLKVGKENTGPAEKTVLSCRLVICKMKIPTGNLLYFLTCFRKKKKSTIYSAALPDRSIHRKRDLKGKTVTEPQMVVFRKAQKDITGLKITGVRISDSEGWRKGQSFNVQVLNMPPEGQITVTAYEGLTGWQRSDAWNVSMEEGKISNPSAIKGIFRLIFEIKNAAGEVVSLAPYYLIVK